MSGTYAGRGSAEVGMLGIAVLCAICAAADMFLGYFLLALCRNEGKCQMIGYLFRIESVESCEADARVPDVSVRRYALASQERPATICSGEAIKKF